MTPAAVTAALLLAGLVVYGWLGWRDRQNCRFANVTDSEDET